MNFFAANKMQNCADCLLHIFEVSKYKYSNIMVPTVGKDLFYDLVNLSL